MNRILVLICLICWLISGCAEKNKGQTQKKQTGQQLSLQKEMEVASDEQLSSFSVSGYAKGGTKQWDLQGKSADIMEEEIRLVDVTGKVYGKDTNVTIIADQGSLNRIDNNVHLEKNVVATTDDGATLTTDYLNWDAQNQRLSNDAPVWLKREMMEANGIGIEGFPALNSVCLKKDVTVKLSLEKDITNLMQADDHGAVSTVGRDVAIVPTVITCDGALDVDYQSHRAVFHDNVRVKDKRGDIFADKMDVYFITQSEKGQKIKGMEGLGVDKLVATGNVEIYHGGNTTYSQKAVYDTDTGKLILTGQPKLVIYSPGAFSQLLGIEKTEKQQ